MLSLHFLSGGNPVMGLSDFTGSHPFNLPYSIYHRYGVGRLPTRPQRLPFAE